MEEEPIRELSENIIKNEQAKKAKKQVFSSASVTPLFIVSRKHLYIFTYLGFFVVGSFNVANRFSPDAVL